MVAARQKDVAGGLARSPGLTPPFVRATEGETQELDTDGCGRNIVCVCFVLSILGAGIHLAVEVAAPVRGRSQTTKVTHGLFIFCGACLNLYREKRERVQPSLSLDEFRIEF